MITTAIYATLIPGAKSVGFWTPKLRPPKLEYCPGSRISTFTFDRLFKVDFVTLSALLLNLVEISDDLKIKYLSRREQDLIDCRKALVNKDAGLLQRVGHQMKGNALTFGHSPLAEIGEAMEISAKAQEWVQLEKQVKLFEGYLKSTPPITKAK